MLPPMFATEPITGAALPDGSLVLTYDDGPGPNTLPVAEYLSGMSIEATFFIVGEFAAKRPDVLARVWALGHRLGNHTWGIVLMQDYTADFPVIAAANRSAELTRALVPMLLADGFRFVPLGAVPIP